MKKNDGRVLVLGTCLFFAIGLLAGIKLSPIIMGAGGSVLTQINTLGIEADIKATFFKELKYIAFLWICGFWLKREALVITGVILKGFFVGCALAWLFAQGGLRGALVYVVPLQIFSCMAVVLAGGAALYGCGSPVKAKGAFVFLIYEVFLIFLGTVLEVLILKII